MFPPNSTSEIISTTPDAAVLPDVTRNEDFPSIDTTLLSKHNEVLSAAAQTNSMFYSDQVPLCTGSFECCEYPVPVLVATVDLLSKAQISSENEFSSASFEKIKFNCDSKDLSKLPQDTLNVFSNSIDNVPVVVKMEDHIYEEENRVESDVCDHSFSCSKSEAMCHISLGNGSGRARADPTSLSIPETSISMSVISSSTCGTTDSPSDVTDCGAEEFASHLCSSSNNSLLTYAQNNSVDFNNFKTDDDHVCVGQAIQYSNIRNQITENDTVESLCSACRNTKRCGETGLPSAIVLLEEKNIIFDRCYNGALNLQKIPSFKTFDGGCNVPHLKNSDANEVRHSILSQGISNIPMSREQKCDTFSFAHTCINATIQGNTDRDPPDSFNDINDKKFSLTKTRCSKYFTAVHICAFSYMGGPASNVRWGIPRGLGLRGGGESTLTSGTSSWSTPPGTSTNNNNNGNTSGWGANSSGQGNTPPQNQWGNSSNSSGNSNNNNNNVNRSGGGSGNSNTQSSSGQQNSGNTAKNNGSQGNQSQAQQPPSSQASQQQSTQSQNGSTSWAQAAGKGLATNPATSNSSNNNGNNTSTVLGANNNNNNSANSNGSSNSSNTSNSGSSSTKQQLEQLNCMREALFSQDGWGGQHVNQDTGWDIPASPEPGAKDGVPVWKPNVNNGTDLWEANLRNGGQPPPSQTQKTPWGHTPTTNIGGTWGEDDDGDSSNVWTGVPANVGPGAGSGQWGGSSAGPSGGNGGMWGGPKKDSEWVGGSSNSGPNWGDPRDPRTAIDPRNVNALDPRDVRTSAGDPRDPRNNTIIDPRDHMRSVVDTMRDPRDIRGGMGDIRSAESMMRGDPRGITGRLNGNDGAMWGQPPHHHHSAHHQQNQPPAMNQWSGPPPKDINLSGSGSKPSGWEEPSPPAQRRNIPNYDDGTSLWGNPGQTQNRMGDIAGKVSHWKEMPQPRAGLQCPPGMPPGRLPGNGSGSLKGDNPLWSHPSRNGSWGDTPHEPGNPGWGDENKVVNVSSWNETPLNASSPWGVGSKPKNPPSWADEDQPWAHKQGPKPLSKDLVWASKQFRILAEMGYKKEDVESALRTCNMNLEDALELLNTGRMNMEWRRHEDHSPFDLTSNHPGSAFSGQRYNPVGQQMSFAPPGGPGVNNTPSLMNNLNNTNPSLASINNISPAIVQKILTQQPPPQQPSHQQTPFNQSSRTPQNQPSTAQLRMLVQQIQMAVQAGYLNHQILNQPLAPQTLILLNQLLQQIKVLQQLMQQQAVVQVPSLKGNSNAVLQISVQITKTKQQINNLQNQIASQQAIYVKQQQQQHHLTSQPPQTADFKPSFHDPLSTLQSSFGDMSLSKESQAFQTQQSRLIQWKLPALDKDQDNGGNEFSRAPGSTTLKPNLPQSHSSPNMNPLLSQGESTWSTIQRSTSDTGWPDSGGDAGSQSDVKDTWPVTTQPGSAAFTDLVPEFEPGKPWKGTQMKSIEDDPSITPGSVVRSPLSLATIKDTEIFSSGNKTSPTVSSSVDTPVPPLSLSSSTWSFNPPASTSTSFTSPLGKLGAPKSTWGDAPPPTAVTSELWGAPVNKSRPPPGLTNKGLSNVSSASTTGGNGNGWNLGSRASWGVQSNSWGSTWLLLKNLTPQIDGSTLKTLCVQHGPVQNFHLYLNHGIALAKYSTREEANKAQGALNNCVLGNTTIFAESPADSEVLQLLQHLGHSTQQAQSSSSASSWSARGTSAPSIASTISKTTSSDTWAPGGSQLWPSNPSSNSLWGSGPLDTSGDQHRATPSSLNSFLPGDLLGGESM